MVAQIHRRNVDVVKSILASAATRPHRRCDAPSVTSLCASLAACEPALTPGSQALAAPFASPPRSLGQMEDRDGADFHGRKKKGRHDGGLSEFD
jgi:hypothetical protein